MPTIRVLIADDTHLLRRLLVDRLNRERDISIIAEAEDGRAAVDLAARLKPDVALLDLDMPHLNGIQATQRILAQSQRVKVILLTGHEQLASLGRLSGASHCLDKACSISDLADAIRSVVIETNTQQSGDWRTASSEPAGGGNATARQLAVGIEFLSLQAGLSARERTVLEKMATTEMTASQIARTLSAQDGGEITESAVKHAMERGLNKLGIEPRTRAALVRCVFEAASQAAPVR